MSSKIRMANRTSDGLEYIEIVYTDCAICREIMPIPNGCYTHGQLIGEDRTNGYAWKDEQYAQVRAMMYRLVNDGKMRLKKTVGPDAWDTRHVSINYFSCTQCERTWDLVGQMDRSRGFLETKTRKMKAETKWDCDYVTWTPTHEQIDNALKEHALWLKSGGMSGKKLDLSHANLEGRNFAGMDLIGADFSYSYMSDVDIRGTNFTDANLAFWFLSNGRCNLNTNFRTDLSRADLSGAVYAEDQLRVRKYAYSSGQ